MNTHDKKRILILGSTGSIGTQALEVIEEHPDLFEVVGIAAAGSNPRQLIEQAKKLGLSANRIAVRSTDAAAQVSQALGGEVIAGDDAARDLVEATAGEVDTVLNGLVGAMGLAATLAAIDSGAYLALANKESLVAGGTLVTERARPGQIVPVDSEHSAMAQAMRAGSRREVARLVLTASGGPFRGWDRRRMWQVTPEQAGKHPVWSMGQMNTLNSATLVNKGLELIEATLLFDVAADDVDVVVHPQSIIHSMVTFSDGVTVAEASRPSMRLPISLALNWPDRVPDVEPFLDFSSTYSWDFAPLDNAAFPAVELARTVARQGKTWPAVYNAANEEAAAEFLAGRLHFPQIVDVIDKVLAAAGQYVCAPESLEAVLAVEEEARVHAREVCAQLREEA
ncbi:1-deoxy-D-xylulose-5-phosphate reductoisomerase [Corynebacterium atypicum]|uniref:1-deoxy-D-xylulose-5-phosphate reductoisomerase n=1 Tax=Corynebacterium atypicum TaxID=191610 RepID=UPI000A9804F5|nr:1-deoxy-D-xylulose-5-phosphate reductoisomerase [Corynebacterium atypicum]